MPTTKYHISVVTEKRDGYWVARIPKLGAFAYGDSAASAARRLAEMCALLFDGVPADEFEERMKRAGLKPTRVVTNSFNWETTLFAPMAPPSAAGPILASVP